jgi:hypothetical protein
MPPGINHHGNFRHPAVRETQTAGFSLVFPQAGINSAFPLTFKYRFIKRTEQA